jgi:NAD(P)-dependent dehydrogenase (short-subunit alcohol dehydrogenase family)
MVGLTKSLALELAPRGIRVNAICPGSIKTQLHETSLEMISRAEGIDRRTAETLEVDAIPMGYSAASDEVAGIAAFLCSDESKYMTGTAIPVAGGMAYGL